ncbi:MAG TPA: sugar ABC transporter permease [Chloroflexota bacterium]|nr:sugar ABC transporter permease [Chloroflexota bacterium]
MARVTEVGASGEIALEVRPRARSVPTARQRAWRRNLTGYLFIAPWLFAFLSFTAIPISASAFLAFTNYNVLSSSLNWIAFDNFSTMYQDQRFWRAVRATFLYAFTAVPLKLIFALGLAMLLNNARRGVYAYRAAYYAPSIVGASVAVAVVWREMFGKQGPINGVLGALGLPVTAWLGDPATAIWTVILLAVWEFGSPMLIFLAGLRQIPQEFYEAAAIDGAGVWRRFRSITLPLLTPLIFFNLVLQMIFGFTVFTAPFIISGGSGAPLDSVLLYSLYLYQKGFRDFQMGYAAAMAWVLLLVVACFTALIFRSSSSWVHYEADTEARQ